MGQKHRSWRVFYLVLICTCFWLVVNGYTCFWHLPFQKPSVRDGLIVKLV